MPQKNYITKCIVQIATNKSKIWVMLQVNILIRTVPKHLLDADSISFFADDARSKKGCRNRCAQSVPDQSSLIMFYRKVATTVPELSFDIAENFIRMPHSESSAYFSRKGLGKAVQPYALHAH